LTPTIAGPTVKHPFGIGTDVTYAPPTGTTGGGWVADLVGRGVAEAECADDGDAVRVGDEDAEGDSDVGCCVGTVDGPATDDEAQAASSALLVTAATRPHRARPVRLMQS
jgi:hypothetical protein